MDLLPTLFCGIYSVVIVGALRSPTFSWSRDPDRWIRIGAYFVPRRHRESFLGDLLEDRAEMREQGLSRTTIELATAGQVTFSILSWPKLLATGILGLIAKALRILS